MRRLALTVALFGGALAGCAPEELPECDLAAATEVVYDAEGFPAYPGQALIATSCGGGGFCHGSDVPVERRHGAPHGFELDVRLASTSDALAPGAVERLARSQQDLLAHRAMILATIDTGVMPPAGVGEAIVRDAAQFDRLMELGPDVYEPLPAIGSDEGRAIVRNFYACGARVVERTERAPEQAPEEAVGWIEEPRERRCVDPTWPDLYEAIIAPSCATGTCHGGAEPAAELDLRALDPEAPGDVAARLVGAPSHGPFCAEIGLPQIDPGHDPMASLLYRKLLGDGVCGEAMPLIGNSISAQRRCAMRVWIECGACPEADGGECAECVDAARAECGVTRTEAGVACAE